MQNGRFTMLLSSGFTVYKHFSHQKLWKVHMVYLVQSRVFHCKGKDQYTTPECAETLLGRYCFSNVSTTGMITHQFATNIIAKIGSSNWRHAHHNLIEWHLPEHALVLSLPRWSCSCCEPIVRTCTSCSTVLELCMFDTCVRTAQSIVSEVTLVMKVFKGSDYFGYVWFSKYSRIFARKYFFSLYA